MLFLWQPVQGNFQVCRHRDDVYIVSVQGESRGANTEYSLAQLSLPAELTVTIKYRHWSFNLCLLCSPFGSLMNI